MADCFGYFDDHGAYCLEGCEIVFAGNRGSLTVVPVSLNWPKLRHAPTNEVSLLVKGMFGDFSGAVRLGVPITCVWQLEADLRALIDGKQERVMFPSRGCVKSLEPQLKALLSHHTGAVTLSYQIALPQLNFAPDDAATSWEEGVVLASRFLLPTDVLSAAAEQITCLYQTLAAFEK